MTDLIKAVDVSSHNPPSRVSLDQWVGDGCQLLVVHCYNKVEAQQLGWYTRQWVQIAREAAVWRLPYLWLFADADPVIQVSSALNLWRDCGETPGLLWIDCESYEGDNGPTVDQILAAVAECRRQGVNAGLYSALWWFTGHIQGDGARLAGLPYWGAAYNDKPDLESLWAPFQLEVVGHQYADKPVDWSVFDLARLSELARGYVAPDPCAELRAGLAAALTDARALVARLEALGAN